MSDAISLFDALRRSADGEVVDAIERLASEAPDRALNRINALAFAAKHGLDPDRVVAAFVHAARIGLFDMAWNVLCPACGGVLDTNASLKTIRKDNYVCSLCADDYSATLDEMVEVTFTIGPRVRRIAAHTPDDLPLPEYFRQIYWGSGVDLPDEGYEALIDAVLIDHVELAAGEKAVLSVHLPPAFIIVFEPVTHSAQFLDVKGEPTRERQALSIGYDRETVQHGTLEMQPGPLRLALENHTDGRVLPSLFIAGDALHDMLGRRRPFLTAKHLLTNQAFQDLYRADTLDVGQRLKITSLTFLFTDLRGSTALYERVGDLVAFDLVQSHFQVLIEIVAAEAGAVVKTIGDAVMATFATPDRALAAALRMREAMQALNRERGSEDLLLKIGLHEGPCIAVSMNERQDYFGQTVNIASRVQGLASDQSIFATEAVVGDTRTSELLRTRELRPEARLASLRGIGQQMQVYAIP
jgi:class 3 adenylate cyclase